MLVSGAITNNDLMQAAAINKFRRALLSEASGKWNE
jgi:hypothetical protein